MRALKEKQVEAWELQCQTKSTDKIANQYVLTDIAPPCGLQPDFAMSQAMSVFYECSRFEDAR